MNEPVRIRDVILKVVQAHLGRDDGVALDTPLFDGGLEMDSVGFLELILKIEKQVGLRLRNEDLTEEALASVGSLIDHIERLVRERG